MPKPVIPTWRALRDIDDAWSYYLGEAGLPVAERFIETLKAASSQLGRQPGIDSPRWVYQLNVEGLRCWPLTGHPYLLFYFGHDDAVDLVRLLHGASDIPAALTGLDAEGPT